MVQLPFNDEKPRPPLLLMYVQHKNPIQSVKLNRQKEGNIAMFFQW